MILHYLSILYWRKLDLQLYLIITGEFYSRLILEKFYYFYLSQFHNNKTGCKHEHFQNRDSVDFPYPIT